MTVQELQEDIEARKEILGNPIILGVWGGTHQGRLHGFEV